MEKGTIVEVNELSKEEKKSIVYNKVDFLGILDSMLVDEEDYTLSKSSPSYKYVELKNNENLKHWRVISVAQLAEKKIFPMFGPVYRQFLNKSPLHMFMFTYMGKKPIGVIIRNLTSKDFADISLGSYIVYQNLPDDFKYGDELFIVEGPYDKEVAEVYLRNYREETGARIYPMSVLTSSVTYRKAELVAMLAKKVYINYDNDKAGENNLKDSMKRLSEFEVESHPISNPTSLYGKEIKDIGDCYPFNDVAYSLIKEQLNKYGGLK